MKIKIIDLLVKIANGEEMPQKIMFDTCLYIYDEEEETYYNEEEETLWQNYNFKILTDEVEIIGEPKTIEKISWQEKESLAGNLMANEKQEILARRTEKLKSSLNELIDEINNLKEK